MNGDDMVAKRVLGPAYGGPSLGYDKEKDQFFVYTWGDAPVGTDEISRADSVYAALKLADRSAAKKLSALSNRELNLLLFLETQAVDNGGKVRGNRMNKEEFDTAKAWNESGFVQFGRLKMADIDSERTQDVSTHWVRLSEAAWAAAHKERRARAVRSERVKEYPK